MKRPKRKLTKQRGLKKRNCRRSWTKLRRKRRQRFFLWSKSKKYRSLQSKRGRSMKWSNVNWKINSYKKPCQRRIGRTWTLWTWNISTRYLRWMQRMQKSSANKTKLRICTDLWICSKRSTVVKEHAWWWCVKQRRSTMPWISSQQLTSTNGYPWKSRGLYAWNNSFSTPSIQRRRLNSLECSLSSPNRMVSQTLAKNLAWWAVKARQTLLSGRRFSISTSKSQS